MGNRIYLEVERMKKENKEKDVTVVEENVIAKKVNNKKSNNNAIVCVIITFCVCLVAYGLFYEFYLKNLVIETTKTIKDVTVTDSGIAVVVV